MDAPTVIFPEVDVAEAEFRRLLGYPRGAQPSARAEELSRWARTWYAEHGRPWIYLREAPLGAPAGQLVIEGVPFRSPQLAALVGDTGANRGVLFAVCAGRACEEHARELWLQGKPDEYFFLETYGSAVVERLTALVNARVCAEADARGLRAIPHYSPGYGNWDVAEQPSLLALLEQGRADPWPEPLEVLTSGMLRPKKSLLGVIGLTAASTVVAPRGVPCEGCTWTPCAYRRAPYRHADSPERGQGLHSQDEALNGAAGHARGGSPSPTYSIATRALEKWSRERLQLTVAEDGAVFAVFRFDGTTCSNMGRPLAFEYRIELGNEATGHRIERATCAPVGGDDGYTAMCEYLRDPDGLMAAIGTPPPLIGQPLDAALRWQRDSASTGCYCDAASRAHKWGMAFEVLHFALSRRNAATLAPDPDQIANQDQVLTTDGHR